MTGDPRLFRDTFARVSDAYGVMIDGWPQAIREPLTMNLIEDHLQGRKRIGAYLVDADGMSDQIVVDLDIPKGKSDDPREWERVRREARALLAVFDDLGIKAFITSSKSRGLHVRSLWELAPAAQLRRIGNYVIRKAGVDAEVFPKQDRRTDGGVGNFVWLPLFGTDLPKGKTAFLDEGNGLTPLPDQWDALRNLRRNSVETLAATVAIVEAWEKESGTAVPKIAPPVGDKIPTTKRNDTLISLAGTMRRRGMSPQAIEVALLTENKTKCSPPLPESEVREIARSVGRYKPAPQEIVIEEPKVREMFDGITVENIVPPDAPRIFHLMLGYVTLAAIVGNRVYFTLAGDKLFPNLWAVVIGPSGMSRKSTSLNKSRSIVSVVDPKAIFAPDFTSEALIDLLSATPQGVFYHAEFRSLYGMLQKDYMSGAKALLTELYDSPEEYRRETKGKSVQIRQPVISMASATTTNWLISRNSDDDFGGGFLARFLFVPVFRRERSLPLPPPTDRARFSNLIRKAHQIREGFIRGPEEAYYSLPAKAAFVDWYRKFDELDPFADTPLAPFHARYQSCVHKLAMIYTLATGGNIKAMDTTALDYATRTVEFITKNLVILYDRHLTFGKDDERMKKLLDLIPEGKAMPRSELLKRSRMKVTDFNVLIATLLETDRITRVWVKGAGAGRKAEVFTKR
jgi:hypothetical protein